jgi:hypothetical protein
MMQWRGWWNLPGPNGFVSEILDALEAAFSVILALPPGTPDGLEESLIAETDERATLRWRAVDISGAKKIAQSMADELIPLARRPPRALAEDIVRDPGLSATIVHVTGFDDSLRFKEFAAFLAEFLTCVRKSGENIHRPRLIFSLPQTLLGHQVEAAHDAVRLFAWHNRVAPSDMHLYVAMRMRGRHGPGPTNLYERIVVELAGWDPKLADEICGWSDEFLLEPLSRMKDLAAASDRGELDWRKGTLDHFGTRQLGHILSHIASGDAGEIERRLWRAHIGEIFPWLEEIRLTLVDLFRDHIRVPHFNQYNDVIEDPSLLEIGQLYRNLRESRTFPEENLAFVKLCKVARDNLAHRRPVSPVDLRRLERDWIRIRGT